MFSGSGVHGAYHAGVLRALQEAGVKIDVVAGHGVGAGAAVLTAIDGASRLWEPDGVWQQPQVKGFYVWKTGLRYAAGVGVVLAAIVSLPLALLGLGLLVYPVGLLLQVIGLGAGQTLVSGYTTWLLAMFSGPGLPSVVPRLALIALVALGLVVGATGWFAQWQVPHRRRGAGPWWWRLMDAPVDASGVKRAFADVIAHLVGNASAGGGGKADAVGRLYAEVLADNLGQPGFRELVLVVADLDTRQDLVATMLREPYREARVVDRVSGVRVGDVLDLTGPDGRYAVELLNAALTLPLACDPQFVSFEPTQFWRGETHRLCDRPGSLGRIIEELEVAGVSQVVVVSTVAPVTGPHRLRRPHLDPLSRLGEYLMTAESSALRQAMQLARLHFQAAYVISPEYNPLGPMDLSGTYDESSDRRHDAQELLLAGYEDAYRQFIEPVVGASGEHLGTPGTRGATGTLEE